MMSSGFQLTPEQTRHFESILWLVDPGPRGVGRSTLMALAFLEIAKKNSGLYVYVFDNNPLNFRTKNHFFQTISYVFDKSGLGNQYELVFNKQTNSIKLNTMEKGNGH